MKENLDWADNRAKLLVSQFEHLFKDEGRMHAVGLRNAVAAELRAVEGAIKSECLTIQNEAISKIIQINQHKT